MRFEHVPSETTALPAFSMDRNMWDLLQSYSSQEAMLLPTGLNGVSTQEEVLRGTILQSLVATYVFGTPGTQSWL